MDVVKVRVGCLKSEGKHKLKQVKLNTTWKVNKYNPIKLGIKQERPTWSDIVRHGPTMVRHGFCVLTVVCQLYFCVSSVYVLQLKLSDRNPSLHNVVSTSPL